MTEHISPTAKIGSDTVFGRFCVVDDNVTIGARCQVGHNVVIHAGSIIGSNVRIDDGTVIGKLPMRAANSAVTKEQELPAAHIGDNCIIGTNVVIYAGSVIGNKVLVADLSTVRENVSIGDFTIVGRGVAIENFCKIGSYCKLETNVYITAYSEVEDRVFIAPCVATSNDNFVGRTKERFKHFKGVTIRKGGRIGVSATILPGKVIGEDTLVAAGALVTSDAPPRKIVAGVPAKVFRDVPPEQLLENQE
ncbi:MAG: N-acetyltransferase [candidate division Zixibacteria bacterium]|nr:N-acetyltransferase [candidate division Zixibacteria bacterium]MBU1469681.1 N-acetyltransferase [candidate division Zixibacteria bacterium]MBU2624750.1 N-acetyltransferase [candidate division Zixibacteria bacterium]